MIKCRICTWFMAFTLQITKEEKRMKKKIVLFHAAAAASVNFFIFIANRK